jgi:hypothetical protein
VLPIQKKTAKGNFSKEQLFITKNINDLIRSSIFYLRYSFDLLFTHQFESTLNINCKCGKMNHFLDVCKHSLDYNSTRHVFPWELDRYDLKQNQFCTSS